MSILNFPIVDPAVTALSAKLRNYTFATRELVYTRRQCELGMGDRMSAASERET